MVSGVSAADFPIEPGEGEAVETETTRSRPFAGRTAWARNLEAPLRDFLRTETGSAAILLIGAVAAMVWINVSESSYNTVWHMRLSVRIGGADITQDVRHWVNNGLMTLFFFVVGLEARREFDLGELRDRRRLVLPVVAGLGGMIVPIAIFEAITAGGAPHGAWGAAMSTDTAFALGMLALVGSRYPNSLRAFILTVAVVDDLVALVVIAIAFTNHVHAVALAIGISVFVLILVLRYRGVHNGGPYLVLGVVAWGAFLESGIDPIVVGLAMGLLTIAYPAAREDLERATDLFRVFREQPTSELQQSARAGLRSAISPNERWQQMFHPFTSYVVVPLFALANAGFVVSGAFLGHAYGSAITLGIIAAYVLGKPIGVTGAAGLVTKLSHGRIRPPVGWVSVLGGGAVAGIGFTVSLLIASLAFTGQRLDEAKLGVLTTVVLAPALSWAIICVTSRLPKKLKLRLLIGRGEAIVDLAVPVDPERDHVRVLRPGRDGDPRAALGLRRPALRVAPPAPQRRPSPRPAGRGGLGGGRGSGQVLGDARPDAVSPGPPHPQGHRRLRPRAGPRHRPLQGAPAQAQGCRPHRRGRGVRGHERCVGHPQLLHQRPPPPGRLRHRHAVQGRAAGAGARCHQRLRPLRHGGGVGGAPDTHPPLRFLLRRSSPSRKTLFAVRRTVVTCFANVSFPY
jgi:Na+/H+ antiporter NhaA